MNETMEKNHRGLWPVAAILLALGGGVAGWAWQAYDGKNDPAASLASRDKAAIEQVVREYILKHPEILPEAMENLRARETSKQLASVGDQVETPFPGSVLGNPEGRVVLVEFTDFACGYCRSSVAEVEQLIKANADLKVVIRQLPILSPASHDAAKMGLAAAEQGKYAKFHRAMFAAGQPDARSIEAAARIAGLDLARANRVAAEPRVGEELDGNMAMARQLGFEGTPSWVIGDEMFSGAVGHDQLAKAIAKARG